MKSDMHMNDALDKDEEWIEEHIDEFVEVSDSGRMRASLIDAAVESTLAMNTSAAYAGVARQSKKYLPMTEGA